MSNLITGASGFIGSVLANELRRKKTPVFDFGHKQLDIRDKKRVFSAFRQLKPKYIFHLAAQSSVQSSFVSPEETFQVNTIGTLNILEAIRKYVPQSTLISFGSSAEYGGKLSKNKVFSEAAQCFPTSPYAISKLAQGQLVSVYEKAYGLKSFHLRPFAIIGAQKKGDAISDFSRGIVEIERGKKKYLSVGRLSQVRDFVDVADAISAIRLVAKYGKYPIYNICTGHGNRLDQVLEILISFSKIKIIVKKEPNKMRVIDDSYIVGNPSRLFELGFKPKYSLEESLKTILDYWRSIDNDKSL